MRLTELVADRVFKELDGDFHRDDSAITNVLADKRAELGSFTFLLFAQEVSGLFSNGRSDLFELGMHYGRTNLRGGQIQSPGRCARIGCLCLRNNDSISR